MQLSVDELRAKVEEFRSSGLSTQQIADELSLSHTTIQWLSTNAGGQSVVVKGGPAEFKKNLGESEYLIG